MSQSSSSLSGINMPFLKSNVCRSRNLLLIAIVLSLNACGSSGPEEAASQTPTVDPRFATAESLLEHYNHLSMQTPKADVTGIFSLLYAENPRQEQMVRVYKSSLPLMKLDDICWEKFGEGFRPDSEEAPFTPALNAAIMTESNLDRAKAKLKENDGGKIDLYLVNYNGRWWLSGYTLEYDKQLNGDGADLNQMENAIGNLAAAAPLVLSKIKSGEIKSVEQARVAFGAEIMRRGP